jgi:hypothetical protein
MKSITIKFILVSVYFISFINQRLCHELIELDFTKKSQSTVSTIKDNFSTSFLSASSLIFDDYPLINNSDDQMVINLCLGTPKQCFNVLIDSGSFFLWVRDIYSFDASTSGNKFDYKNSTTFENSKIPYLIKYGTGMATGEIVRDSLTLGNKQIDPLNFILVNNDESNQGIDGILGLGYYYDNLREKNSLQFSLIDQLYDNKLIKSKIFTQKYTSDKRGKMYIGDLPEEIQSDMDHYGTCRTIKYSYSGTLNPRWECSLKKMFYGNENVNGTSVKAINDPVLFDTGTNMILIPVKYLYYLKVTYFKDLVESDICTFEINSAQFIVVKCLPVEEVLRLPYLNFAFDDWIIRMRPRELFYKQPDGFVYFAITASNEINIWIFGEPILKKFHVVFDKTNDVIGFYSTRDLYKYDQPFPDDSTIILTVVLVIVAILLLLGFLYLVKWFYKNRKKQLEYYRPEIHYNIMRISDI